MALLLGPIALLKMTENQNRKFAFPSADPTKNIVYECKPRSTEAETLANVRAAHIFYATEFKAIYRQVADVIIEFSKQKDSPKIVPPDIAGLKGKILSDRIALEDEIKQKFQCWHIDWTF